ncbi:MAG: PfkB family carbohydrate kinase [Candidatus Bathyarchaeota archaeon]|nr:PfkB family carbohydrate kinase [Candidatus Bathyarchaeota archaeon]
MADFGVVGHVAIDKIITTLEERTQLGGPPSYISLVTTRLGKSVSTITKVGSDISNDFISQLDELGVGLEGMIVDAAETTRFILDYRSAERRMIVGSICEEIGPHDVSGLSEVVLLAPIVGEIPPLTVSSIDADLIALDPQGFVRDIRPDGSILPKRWFDESLLRRLTIFKSSEEELKIITREANPLRGLNKILGLGAEIAMATKGGEGALLAFRRGFYRIPPSDVGEALDPTGAGDAFIGGFFSEYLEGERPSWCASMGAALASCVVETIGTRIEASLKQIRERAEDVYNRVVRL